MLDKLIEFLEPLANLLNIYFIESKFILINLYSLIHVTIGFVTMFILYKIVKNIKIRFLILFLTVVSWELFELVVIKTGSDIFRVDPFVDTFWDLITGMLGGLFYWYLKKNSM